MSMSNLIHKFVVLKGYHVKDYHETFDLALSQAKEVWGDGSANVVYVVEIVAQVQGSDIPLVMKAHSKHYHQDELDVREAPADAEWPGASYWYNGELSEQAMSDCEYYLRKGLLIDALQVLRKAGVPLSNGRMLVDDWYRLTGRVNPDAPAVHDDDETDEVINTMVTVDPEFLVLNGVRLTEAEIKQIVTLCKYNMRVDAIKYVRRVTGSGLRRAKEFVDLNWPSKYIHDTSVGEPADDDLPQVWEDAFKL